MLPAVQLMQKLTVHTARRRDKRRSAKPVAKGSVMQMIACRLQLSR